MKKRHLLLPLATCLFFSSTLLACPPRVQPCKPYQLSFNTDNENGAFNGMSQSGTLLVLRNLSPSACTVPGRPVVIFQNSSHHALPATLQTPRGMHPGPVILPVVIPAGAEVTSRIRWVSNDAYGANNSNAPAFLSIQISGHALTRKFQGRLFGPAGKHPQYTESLFRRDPSYQPPCPSTPAPRRIQPRSAHPGTS
jgi:hypothetical protein